MGQLTPTCRAPDGDAMTGKQWQTCSDPFTLLERACERVSWRKRSLLLAAFCERLASCDVPGSVRVLGASLAQLLNGDMDDEERRRLELHFADDFQPPLLSTW